MKSTAKAQATLRDVADKLKVRFPAKTIRAANDANGWPMLFISNGSEAAGASNIALRMTAQNAVSKDVFGNDLVAFAPHTLEVAYELGASAGTVASRTDLVAVEFEAIKTGVKIDIKEIANATAVTEASMNAAAVAVELDNQYWPTKGV